MVKEELFWREILRFFHKYPFLRPFIESDGLPIEKDAEGNNPGDNENR
jgi:hypothetical protein